MATTEFRRSRSGFWLRVNENENGSYNFYVSARMCEIFEFHFQEAELNAPKGWEEGKKHSGIKSLWIPPDRADGVDVEAMKEWASFAVQQCVWLETGSEIDYCIAGDFNRSSDSNGNISSCRTPLGEAEYQLKYNSATLSPEDKKEYANLISHELFKAFDLLPLRYRSRKIEHIIRIGRQEILPPLISPVPARETPVKLAWALAQHVARVKEFDCLSPYLRLQKPQMKSLSLEAKKNALQALYVTSGAVELPEGIVNGREVVIIDDLYQSGATLHAYANFLKQCGAVRVFGLTCVKSMRDSDNL